LSYAVVHMQKSGKGAVRGLQSHNQREKESHTNFDIDATKTNQNYDLINSEKINYHEKIKDVISELPLKKAVRKDAVLMCNFVVTSDSEFFKNLDPGKQQNFFEDSKNFFAERYGEKNIIHATVHLDEKTPHMHLGIVPVTKDNCLSAKKLFDRNELKSLQTDFANQVGKKYGLERGVENSDRVHLSEQRFKVETAKSEYLDVKERGQALMDKFNALSKAYEGKVLSVKEIEKIQPEKAFGGSLKNITLEDIDNLKKSALECQTYKFKFNDIQNKYDTLKKELPEIKEKEKISIKDKLKQAKELNEITQKANAYDKIPKEIKEQYLEKNIKSKNKELEI